MAKLKAVDAGQSVATGERGDQCSSILSGIASPRPASFPSIATAAKSWRLSAFVMAQGDIRC